MRTTRGRQSPMLGAGRPTSAKGRQTAAMYDAYGGPAAARAPPQGPPSAIDFEEYDQRYSGPGGSSVAPGGARFQ